MTIKNYIGDKLSTQSFVLGKQCQSYIMEHHSVKKHQIYCLEKLNRRDLYNKQLILKVGKPAAQTHFKKNFQNLELGWKNIYNLPRRVMINTNLDIFRYKLILNILCPNKLLYKFEQKVSPLCSFCMEESESRIHLFHSCNKISLDAATTFYPKCTNNRSNIK